MEDEKIVVYRFFREEYQADALVDGKVWISTLGVCRAYENPGQGDPNEGVDNYFISEVTNEDKNACEIAARAGFRLDPKSKFKLSRVAYTRTLPDAYVICATLDYNPEKLSNTFGKFCVQIQDSDQFFLRVSTELIKPEYEEKELVQGVAGPIQYVPTSYEWANRRSYPIGFMKSPDQYSEQKEYRFLWTSRHKKLIPFLLDCPEVKGLCKRIA